MKKRILLFILLTILSLFLASAAFAEPEAPVGSCPNGFHLHPFMEHHDGEHQHIGVERDLNGDGWTCAKHVTEELHVHVDNMLPLP